MTSGAGATFTHDEANRIATVTETSGGETFYGYDASNKRIYARNSSGRETFTFYGAKGENLGDYRGLGCSGVCLTARKTNLWFGGRLVATMGAQLMTPQPVFQDRVGTDGLHRSGPQLAVMGMIFRSSILVLGAISIAALAHGQDESKQGLMTDYYPAVCHPALYPAAACSLTVFRRHERRKSVELPVRLELFSYAPQGNAIYDLSVLNRPKWF